MRKFILIIFICISLLSITKAQASVIGISPSKINIDKREQFYIDVMLDPQSQSINGVEGNINFPNNKLSFVRAEEGQSIISLWIQKPTVSLGSISFAGIIPNGFSGLIDPFNSKERSPGLLIRLVFEGKNDGQGEISVLPFTVTLNDGLGTIETTPASSKNIFVSNKENKSIYKKDTDTIPVIDASVVRDPSLFENKYTLIFKASDKGSGIESVVVQEGSHDWKNVESPYVLEDQTRHSTIKLRATNFSGSNVVVTIDPLPIKFSSIIYFGIIILIFMALYFILKKKYVSKK